MKVKVNSLSPKEEQELIDDATGQSVVDHYEKLISFWKSKYESHKASQNFLINKQGQVIQVLKEEVRRLKDVPEQPRGPSFLEDEANKWNRLYHEERRKDNPRIVTALRLEIDYLKQRLEEYRKYFSERPSEQTRPRHMAIGNKSYNRRNKRKSKVTSGKGRMSGSRLRGRKY